MLDTHKEYLTKQLSDIVTSLGYKPVSPEWRNIPFLGAWGVATSIAYRLASQEIEGFELDKKTRSNIARDRAPEIAQQIAKSLQSAEMAGRVKAQGGYVNVYFDIPELASRLAATVLADGPSYGRGNPKPTRIMVEYSQPNTHKAFHVGHLRNVCLGHSLSLVLDFAGFDTIPVNYIGDIGMHVIKCLWCYSKFHEGQEPEQDKGKWLGQVYTEADQRVGIRDQVIDLIHDLLTLPGFQGKVHHWASTRLDDLTRGQFLCGVDPGWQSVVGDLKAGIESTIREKREQDSTDLIPGKVLITQGELQGEAKGEGSGPVKATFDNLTLGISITGTGAALHRHLLEELLSGRSLESSLDFLEQVADEDLVATAIREHVPALWSELGTWMQSQVPSTDETAWQPEQQQTLVDLIELYQILDGRMGWWPEVDQWRKEIRALFLRWDAKDPEVVALWEKTREWSMNEFREIYDFLGAEFDVWFYESQVEEEGKEIVDDMVEKRLAQDLRPDGPVLIHIDDLLGVSQHDKDGRPIGEYRSLLILRSDGTSLYSTKDLALAKRKYEDYGVDRSIYVVDVRQSFYFKQVFKALELWGFEQARDCYHLAYEIVTDPTGAMSSRAGNVIPFEDFADTAVSRALDIVEAKNPTLTDEQKRDVAGVVALGAIKYPMLSVDNDKVITFDLEQALSFTGQSAPYIQYAHARACRIIEKAGALSDLAPDYSHLGVLESSEPTAELKAEINLLEKIADFPDTVQKAAENYKSLLIATYVFELASLFTDFYQKCDVLRGDIPDGVRAARLQLVQAARQTLTNGLALLGIESPEVM